MSPASVPPGPVVRQVMGGLGIDLQRQRSVLVSAVLLGQATLVW